MLSRRMLSAEDEAAVGNEEQQVRREDQDKINRFSRLHNREATLVEELKVKQAVSNKVLQKEKEDLEEVSNELELADEDDRVPYKLGDSFIHLPVSEVQELLSASVDKASDEVSKLEDKLGGLRDEMETLKVALYARFGKSINLEV